MDKAEHGRLLKRAMSLRETDRQAIADACGVEVRTVTNWTSGATMPTERQRAALRKLLGEYDDQGDMVEVALRQSGLQPWRQSEVVALYQRHVHEQEREAAG